MRGMPRLNGVDRVSAPTAQVRLPATRERGVLLDPQYREQRDPRASTQRIGWQAYGEQAQVSEWDAEQAFRLGYLANVVAYRCVQLRANASSSPPWVSGRKLGDSKTINPNAELTKLLGPPPGGPAPRLSARKLLRWTTAQKIVTGRRAWEIERDSSGRPIRFWPLVSSQLHPTASRGGNEWFSKFRYGDWTNPVMFKPEDVFYGWEPSGTDFRQPESGLQASRYNLTLVTMCDRYSVSFLKNNAVPATIITTTPFPNEEMKRAFARQWQGEFGGVDNAGRFWHNEVDADGDNPIGNTIHVEQLGLTAKDSKLVEQRKAAMIEVAMSLGTPWSKLDASGRTYENADAEDRDWWENTILPDLIDLQDDINMQLAPQLGSEVGWFDLSSVRALKRKLIPVAELPKLVDGGIMTKNEARVEAELDPIDDPEFDEFHEPAPMPAALANAQQPALPPAADDGANAPNDDGTTDDEEGRGVPAAEDRAVDPEQVELRRTRIWRASDSVARGLEGRWERTWHRLFARQSAAVIARLTGKRGRQATRDAAEQPSADGMFDRAFWEAETREVVESLYEETTAAGLGRVSLTFGIDFDLSAPYVRDFIEARTNQLSPGVTQTTYEGIQRALIEGVDAGEGVPELADRIRNLFAETYKDRAVTIARTEVMSAYNGAAQLGATQLPADVVAGQEWIATRDARTREQHAEADGQTVAIGTPFTVGGHELAYPGDPAGGASNTVNCRCTIAFLTPEEMADQAARSKRSIDKRGARALLELLPSGGGFDIRWRRAAEEVAA